VQQQVTQTVSSSTASTSVSDPKRPYGGLVPSQPKGTRAYQDAASYNHHLAQHQAYTAQAHAATQAANNAFRNPYITPQNPTQSSSSSYVGPQDPSNPGFSSQQPQYVPFSLPTTKPHWLTHQSSTAQLAVNTSGQQYPSQPSGGGTGGLTVPSTMGPAPPSNTYYSSSRGRANTINQMDAVPPALARLQHMNQDVIAGRNALTPVLNRDDAMREWERRQAGKPPAAQPYPQLEFLQQQAELAAASGLTNWPQQPTTSGRYQPPTSKLSHSYAPTIVIEDDRQNTVMSNVRNAARADGPNSSYPSSAVITSPPQAYASNSTANNRYASNYPQQQTPTSPFDTLDRRTDIGNMFVPMQPDHYQSYSNSGPSSATQPQGQPRNIVPPQQAAAAPSFYGPGVANVVAQGQSNNGQQRNPFSVNSNSQQGQMGEGSRTGGKDVWPR
jgi:dual specificity protein kinase YAK1